MGLIFRFHVKSAGVFQKKTSELSVFISKSSHGLNRLGNHILHPTGGPKPSQATNSKRAKPIPSLGNCPKAKAVSGLPTFIMILEKVSALFLTEIWSFPTDVSSHGGNLVWG